MMLTAMSRITRNRTLHASLATYAALGIVYSITKPSQAHLTPANHHAKTFVFPRDMLSPKTLQVSSVEQLNHDTKRITFQLPGGGNEISGISPGGAVLTQHTPKDSWLPILRPYTPVHDLNEKGILQLLIKKYPEGRASTYMHSLIPGDKLKVWGPKPGPWRDIAHGPCNILFIAGGAGIAPLYSLTKGILRNPNDRTRIRLLWGINSVQDIVLREEFAALEKQYPDRLQVTYVVSKPGVQPHAQCGKNFREGYINKSMVQEAMEDHGTEESWGDWKGRKVFICGPPAMEAALLGRQGIFAQIDISKAQIYRF